MTLLGEPISPKGLAKLLSWTVCGTLACVVVSLTFNYFLFYEVDPKLFHRAMGSALFLPVVLAAPLFFYLTLKMRELAIANHKLRELASTDSLTGCLNRLAFTKRVDGWMENSDPDANESGALLIIDADYFKAVNDRFGHQKGDEALRLIADAVRTVVRGNDAIGRVGGEEFGIFLPGAGPQLAAVVAERIRKAVADTAFYPGDTRWKLTVSIGAVVFSPPTQFSELFKLADERLYMAKELGRNRVEIRRLIPTNAVPELRIH